MDGPALSPPGWVARHCNPPGWLWVGGPCHWEGDTGGAHSRRQGGPVPAWPGVTRSPCPVPPDPCAFTRHPIPQTAVSLRHHLSPFPGHPSVPFSVLLCPCATSCPIPCLGMSLCHHLSHFQCCWISGPPPVPFPVPPAVPIPQAAVFLCHHFSHSLCCSVPVPPAVPIPCLATSLCPHLSLSPRVHCPQCQP